MSTIRTTFVPVANRAGKVTASAEKRADLLNSLGHGQDVLTIAMQGKGALAREARGAVQTESLPGLMSSPTALSGRQVNTLRVLLVAEYGEALYSRTASSGVRGLAGLSIYLQAAEAAALSRMLSAETFKAQERATATVGAIRSHMEQLASLLRLEDAAKVAANAANAANADSEAIATALDAAMVRTTATEATTPATPAKAKATPAKAKATTKKGEPKPIKGSAHAVTA